MNRLLKIQAAFLAVLLVGFLSCDHDTEPFDGPGIIDRFGPFNLVTELGVSQPTVDFSVGESVFFTAEFNKNIDWVIEITGQTSGAVKRIEGFSKTIDASNATWDGGTTVLPLFRAEPCTAVLIIPEEPSISSSVMVTTQSGKDYDGILFTDFESTLGSETFVGNFEFELTAGQRSDTPAEGGQYYIMEGTDDVVPNFFVGLVDISSTVAGNTYMQFPNNVPEDIYFNCFMHSEGTAHGIGIIDFGFDTNGNGEFDPDNDLLLRVGEYDLSTWEGWRQISHPMSDTGVTEADLGKLVGIRMILISNMNSQPNPPIPVGFGIDYMTFTAGGPLEL